ncbi:MAG: hypothetical protein JSR87_12925 [Proteobacteria bacterium]|nr:hypothetical protein [Pseudomonadota bacterium]MBS0572357.1 hypothetical protein [Pseudomonadota bacterium]
MSDSTVLGTPARASGPGAVPASLWLVMIRASASLAFALVLLAFLWGRTINHDTAWYLVSTRKWLEGARLYVDLYDVNPPLASYLTVPAIWISEALSIGDVNGQYAFLAALTGISLFVGDSLLGARIAAGAARRALAFLGLGAVLTLPSLPEFGQREHLMALFVLPWFIGQIPVSPGVAPRLPARVLLAVAAAVGICIKPYFLPIPIAVTAWHCLGRRSLWPLVSAEALAMIGTGAAYVVATALFHPAFLADAVPTARQVYLSFGLPDRVVAGNLMKGCLPYLAYFILVAISWRRAAMPGLLVAGILAGLACYLLQWSGFGYHLVPFWTFANLAVLWTLVQSPKLTPLAVGALLATAGVGALAVHRGTYQFRALPEIEAAMGTAPSPRSLFAATTSVDAGPLLALQLGATWASRYPQNWTLPGALAGLATTDCAAEAETCARLRAILDRTRDADLTDIATFRPEMILIDKRRLFIQDRSFDWYAFLAADPRWRTLSASYGLAGSTANFDVWRLRAAGS